MFTGVGTRSCFWSIKRRPDWRGRAATASVNGALGGSIVIGAGEWFGDANVEMTKLGAIGGQISDERGQPIVAPYVRVLAGLMVGGAPHFVAGPRDEQSWQVPDGCAAGRAFVVVPSVAQSVQASMSAANMENMGATPAAARAQAPVTSAIIDSEQP